jgi:hypothetical protein
MTWFNEIKKPQRCKVISFKITPKGMILYTSDYEIFLWANSKACKDLTAALHFWVEEDNKGYEIFIVPNPETKLGFDFELGNELTYFHEDNLWSIDENEVGGTNMFLAKVTKAKKSSPLIPFSKEEAKKGNKKLMEEMKPHMDAVASTIVSKDP